VGGAVCVSGSADSVTLSNDTISRNVALGGNGGYGGYGGNGVGTHLGSGGSGGFGGDGGGSMGGGVYVSVAGSMTLVNDTLSSNLAEGGFGGRGGFGGKGASNTFSGFKGGSGAGGGTGGSGAGGGLFVTIGTVYLTNDTIAGNSAIGRVGGLGGNGGAGGNGTFINFTGGRGGNGGDGGDGGDAAGGGIFVGASTYTLANTLIAENSVLAGTDQPGRGDGGPGSPNGTNGGPAFDGEAAGHDVSGSVLASDHDLIGDPSGSTGFGNPGSGDLLNVNPDLGPLQYNGGPTETMALQPNSPAIDAGSNALIPIDPSTGQPFTTDQRGPGYARISGSSVDIGAYELQQFKPQTITFNPLPNKTYGDSDFALAATASSGLPVSYSASGDATVYQESIGNWFAHITGAGTATITASQLGNTFYFPAANVSQTFTIAQATTALSDLTMQQIIVGTNTTTVSGKLTSNTVAIPVGQSVSISVNGVTEYATVATGGSFSVSFTTSGLGVGGYPISYSYAGDNNFTAASGTGGLTVAYGTQLLFNNSKPVHSGADLPIKLAPTDANGSDISSPNIAVTAVALADANGNPVPLNSAGNANPNNLFRYDPSLGGYIFNLSTKGLAAGNYTLYFTVGNDPTRHSLTFVVD
jgi:hypothetical protein